MKSAMGHAMRTTDQPIAISMDKATRRFGDVLAVDAVSLEAPCGIIVGLVGPSGSGKTTVIRLLTGTLAPTSGSVRVLGEDPRRFRNRTRERMGYMAQQFVHYPELTVRENVDFVASLFGILWPARHRRVKEVLELVELYDVRDRLARDLSGGMQRRLSLACALVNEPDLVFLDEPTAGVDPILRRKIWSEFRLQRDDGRSLLVTTQYVAEAEYCDLVAVISEGQLRALAAPEQLRRDAFGGEVVEVTTAQAVDAALVAQIGGVKVIRQQEPRRFLVVAEDAAATIPRIVGAVQDRGAGVLSAREYRPPFDDVFAELLDHRSEQAPGSEAEGAA